MSHDQRTTRRTRRTRPVLRRAADPQAQERVLGAGPAGYTCAAPGATGPATDRNRAVSAAHRLAEALRGLGDDDRDHVLGVLYTELAGPDIL
jgi:hypothetical protein